MGDVGKSFKKQAKLGFTAAYNPAKGTKDTANFLKGRAKEIFPKPETPEPTEAETQLQNRQREELAKLDEEENVRLKRGLRGRQGSRLLSSRLARASTSGAGTAASTTVKIPRAPSGGRSAY
jgi:hypothetical protein